MASTMSTPAAATSKWTSRASIAGPVYASGVQASGNAQSQNAIAQADVWLQGVNQAGTASFTRGLQAAQQANKYQNRVASVGVQRYPQGITAGANAFQSQITKVLQVEGSVQLSPKGPKGSAANQLRSTEMQSALRAAKVAGQFQS